MEISQTVNLYITYLEKEGPFLKVWGQTDKGSSIYVEQFLLGASPQFDAGVGNVPLESLQVGTLVCAKYKDSKYYRARITNASFLNEGFVEVSFLDYGNKDLVPCSNIRNLQSFPSSFISIPSLATGFIFAEAHCSGGGEWNDVVFENISKEIKYREVQCTIIAQATQYYLVKIYIGGSDLCSLLINRGYMQPIALQAQQAVLLSMSMQRSNLLAAQTAPSVSAGINTYKACTLEPGCQYPVYVSYVNDGPCHFSVQLKQSEDVLVKLMNDINSVTLRLLEDVPIPGTICLARCQEDGNVCRAVVTNEVDNQFKVFYVDFGNYEVVPLDALFQIPFKYVIPRVMAIRFCLAGVEKSTVTLEMQCAFKQFVDNRLLYMKVLPAPTRMAVSKCELWDPETKTSALDVVNRAAQNAYPEPVSLNRGFSQLVKVSYVYSCNRFYVQLASKENELLKLMLDLQASCQINEPLDPSCIKVGLPCCTLFDTDGQWYRSQIVEVLGDSVKVRYIDYGNEEIVSVSLLKIIEGEQLTVLRPQAIECCLNGYQNMEEDIQRDTFLEELILGEAFTMKVVDMVNKRALVELFNDSNYNVASLLLDKIAAAQSQVSPLLVQVGNKIDHRQSFSNQNGLRDQNFKQDRKPGRTNDRRENSWRQEKKDFRSNDERNSNENTNDKNSWRQNNKGFSPNTDRFNNREKYRNKNDWQNKENLGNDDSRPTRNDNWGEDTNTDFHNDSRKNDFNSNKGGRPYSKDNWNSGAQKSGGFKKRGDFRKDGSDISSSGSEKSFNKGPRTSSRNERIQHNKKFDKPRNKSFNRTDDSWNVSSVSSIDPASSTATFTTFDVIGSVSNVNISWFHNPGHFYCQLVDYQEQFKDLMKEIQLFYKDRTPESAVVGAPIVGLFPEDNVLYRAQVLEILGNQYKIFYVDFGNVSNVTKVWPIEKKFMNLPAQAIACSLNEIAPPGDKWPDFNNYSKYFDKDIYVCKFVNKDEEKTYVDFFYGEEDIRQLLIRDGLAVSTQSIIPIIEIPLLLGQQFRAIVKSINNLSDIIIALECGVALNCKIHNLENAATVNENNLKCFLERVVIIYVDSVVDDKLEITVYDIEGTKIEVITPDEGSFDMVELPCPILIFRSTLSGYVSHVDDKSIFVQPTEYADTVSVLLDQMYEAYENLVQEDTIIPDVELIYAVKSEDGNWYRARVSKFDDTKASVYYIDYGNSEDVEFDKLRQLSDKFLEISTLCVQVLVNVPTDSFIDKEVVANIWYGENGWEGTISFPAVETSATESEVIERQDVQKIHDEVLEKSVDASTSLANELEVSSVIESEESRTTIGIQVIVSHIDSPDEFYVQLADSLYAIEELQVNLQEQVADMPVLENPTAGILCAAPFSVDQQWYRAEVLDADDDITTVRFIDFGNTDVINNETTQIKTLPPNLLSLAVYATRSSLKVKPVDGEWSSNAIARFEELINVNNVTAEFRDQDEKTNYVELYADGQAVRDVLINENLAIPFEFSEEIKSTCFVSHLNSPSEFWLQLENCVDELEWIAEQLSGAENFPELEDTTPGTLCAALFPDDQMWYRARILSNTVAGLELLFIDYGSSSISSSLRQLPEDLVVTPPLAQKCSLQKPNGIVHWSPQAVNKFVEVSADGETIFTVRKITTGETSIVQLFVDGIDVTSMLLPETEEGYVKNVDDLDNLTIEKNGEVLHGNYKLEPLPGTTWTEESTAKFKELNDQGSKLLQIEFINENTVRLYDNGNDIRVNLGGVRTAVFNLSKTSVDDEESDEMYGNTTVPLDEMMLNETVEDNNTKATENTDDNIQKNEDAETLEDNNPTVIENEDVNITHNKDSNLEVGVKLELLESSSDDIKRILGISANSADNTDINIVRGDDNISHTKEVFDTELEKDQDEKVLSVCDPVPESQSNDDSLSKDKDKDLPIEESNTNVTTEDKSLIEEDIKLQEKPLDSDKSTTDETINEQFQEEVCAKPESPKENLLSEEPTLECESSAASEVARIMKDVIDSVPLKDDIIEENKPVSSDPAAGSTVDWPKEDTSTNQGDAKDENKKSEELVKSRSGSACSGKIDHDERIVPAVASRPHSPLLKSDDAELKVTNEN